LNGESGRGVDDDRTMVPEFEEDDKLSAFDVGTELGHIHLLVG